MVSQLGFNESQFFNTMGRIFHFNTTSVREILANLKLILISSHSFNKLSRDEIHKYCQQRGMKMAMLKTLNELQKVSEQIIQRKNDRKKEKY